MELIVKGMIGAWLAGAAICFVGYFLFAYRMWKGRKPGVDAGRVLGNPFNICFQPSLLTEEGLRARKRFFLCSLGFLFFVGAPCLLLLVVK